MARLAIASMSSLRVILLKALVFCSFICTTLAQNSTDEFDEDPYLQYRPPFVRSLPVQILLTGVVLTLVAVLFIHLVFTAQYHWPLAPVNYVLQLSGVTTLLISLIATLNVVLSSARHESEKWPYMLSYLAVNVPPLDLDKDADTAVWSLAQRAAWLVMKAATSGLIQITHIQFLTLLYPSRLEARLIFALLGPLAIVAAVMQLLPIQENVHIIVIASAIRNVCNATLSLLFTASLFIWGFLIKRKQAWRTDGGTAAFGCAALLLALGSTGLTFLYVPREEEYVWLPALMWAVVLWQNFLGWWWWVGAGSGSALGDDVQEMLRREEKRKSRKKDGRKKRKGTKARTERFWAKVVAGPFGTQPQCENVEQSVSQQTSHPDSRNTPNSPHLSPLPPPNVHAPPLARSISTISLKLSSILPSFLRRWYTSLRYAHQAATRQQAVERLERIRESNKAVDEGHSGWGLGSFAWRLGHEKSRKEHPEIELHARGEMQNASVSNTHTDEVPVHPPDCVDVGSVTNESNTVNHPDVRPRATEPSRPRTLWWWGPIARWRLQDSIVY